MCSESIEFSYQPSESLLNLKWPHHEVANLCSPHKISQAMPILPREAPQASFLSRWLSRAGILLVDNGRSRRRTNITNAFMPTNHSPIPNFIANRARLCRANNRRLRYRLSCRLGRNARGEAPRFTPGVCSPADCPTTDPGNLSARAGTLRGRSIDSHTGDCRGPGMRDVSMAHETRIWNVGCKGCSLRHDVTIWNCYDCIC